MDQTNSQRSLRSDDIVDGDHMAAGRAGAWIRNHSIRAHHVGVEPAHSVRERSVPPNHNGWCDDYASLSQQLSVIQEMICTFDTLTTAGQRYNMSKIVAFGRDQVARACDRLSRRHRSALAHLLEKLDRESVRSLPDTLRFGERVERLVGVLASTA